ncbi:RecX family transcriptional regulator [Acholeplasma hippikon]|uniref:Regulatory protein recX n=1 Tax=Acholeplasma hippikon TaxID=264636 RepID=A0A449BJN2_9MOLU|nr:RecX family transcriptional regulator [Acholeplasma hippikon]VEU82659.1 Regulatory protein recX [Acholeplasma hippikon]
MKIIEIKKLKKNYQITFDNFFKLIVDEDTVVKYRLVPNKEISDISIFEKEMELNKLYDKAVRYASYGKSENQMIKYLNEQGMDNTYEFIKRLKKDHLINDYQMINSLKRKGYSYLKLQEKLHYYDFDSDLIENALSSYDESKALDKEFAIGLKKYSKEQSYQKKQEKLYRYLISKGFNEEKVRSRMNILD